MRSGVESGAIRLLQQALVIWALATMIGSAAAQSSGDDISAAVKEVATSSALHPAAAVLDRLCARCHQDGKLERGAAAGGFGNILDLERAGEATGLVVPGNPDGSLLYQMLVAGKMPPVQGQSAASRPTPDDILAVHDWIVGLRAKGQAACTTGQKASASPRAERALALLADVGDAERKFMRFITTSHLRTPCTTAKQNLALRDGVAVMLNAISRAAAPLSLQGAQESAGLIRIDIRALGWLPGTWEVLGRAYPYARAPLTETERKLAEQTGTPIPMVTADWLAFAALRPPLYHTLLDLPRTLDDVKRYLGRDPPVPPGDSDIVRAGVMQPANSTFPRLLERWAVPDRWLWLSHDFSSADGATAMLPKPLGPSAEGSTNGASTRLMFPLPNGFPAYLVTDALGVRVDRVQPALLVQPAGGDHASANGISCLGCHTTGPRPAADSVRALVERERGVPRKVKDRLLALHRPGEELAMMIAADQAAVMAAMERAGIDPKRRLLGVAPVVALSKLYERSLDNERLARELGIEPKRLLAALAEKGEALRSLARELSAGVVARGRIERDFPEIAKAVGWSLAGVEPRADGGRIRARDLDELGRFSLTLTVNKPKFEPGDEVLITATASIPCHLTVYNVRPDGRATVLFPNAFEQANLLKAAEPRSIPGSNAPYKLRVRARGSERVIAYCNANEAAAPGVAHDFERQKFTLLGDWRAFLKKSVEAVQPKEEARPVERRRRARRGRRQRIEEEQKPPAPTMSVPRIEARNGVVIEVQ